MLFLFAATAVSAQEHDAPILQGLEEHIGLILLIASIVIIALLILMLFYLHSISEHLSWIRRIR
jgi:hypothetical protein